jgi:group II intron reverse transcriptase/maturase
MEPDEFRQLLSVPRARGRNGKKRKLGIPTVSDRVAQQVIKSYLEPRFESIFSEHSYGYRPNKNAHQALGQVRKNVRKYCWVVDMDIAGFFDNMSHTLLMKAMERHVGEKWVLMYIDRWLNAPVEDRDGKTRYRNGKGTPQGGVISPLLANLFLHYAFDKWFSIHYPHLSFVRYADDLVVHCTNQKEAEQVLDTTKKRLEQCKLQAHEKKTKIVFCKDANRKGSYPTVQFDFLGYSFQPRPTANVRMGVMFLGFDCAISRKSEKKITDTIRRSKFHSWTNVDITYIARYFNSRIQGWINYYGKFRKRNLMRIFRIFHNRLMKWVMRRYKRIKKRRRRARKWLLEMIWKCPSLFVHWQHGFQRA